VITKVSFASGERDLRHLAGILTLPFSSTAYLYLPINDSISINNLKFLPQITTIYHCTLKYTFLNRLVKPPPSLIDISALFLLYIEPRGKEKCGDLIFKQMFSILPHGKPREQKLKNQ